MSIQSSDVINCGNCGSFGVVAGGVDGILFDKIVEDLSLEDILMLRTVSKELRHWVANYFEETVDRRALFIRKVDDWYEENFSCAESLEEDASYEEGTVLSGEDAILLKLSRSDWGENLTTELNVNRLLLSLNWVGEAEWRVRTDITSNQKLTLGVRARAVCDFVVNSLSLEGINVELIVSAFSAILLDKGFSEDLKSEIQRNILANEEQFRANGFDFNLISGVATQA